MFALLHPSFELPASAFDWLGQVLSAHPGNLHIEEMSGSTSSTLFQVSLTESELPFVLRCHTNPDWLKEEPDVVVHEAGALAVLAHSDIPAPRVVAVDPFGAYCSVPSLLMTSLPGRVILKPHDLHAWLLQIAQPLQKIHSLPATGFGWKYSPYVNPANAQVPNWTHNPDLWQRVIDVARRPLPDFTPAFIHRDYHPANLLFENGQLSGIVDWPNACLGPADFDIAWCRQNLTWMYGVETADRFLSACREIGGIRFTYDPFWDILAGIEVLPGPIQYYPPWQQFGLPSIAASELLRREEALLKSALQQIRS